jgi:PAS domain-containing protein
LRGGNFAKRSTSASGSGFAQELEQAYDLKDGTHWFHLFLRPLPDKFGDSKTLEVFLTGIDITPRMELKRQLEIATSRFRAVVDTAYSAIITIDQEHNITLLIVQLRIYSGIRNPK